MNNVYCVDFEGNGEPKPDIVELALVEVSGWERSGNSHYWLFHPSAPISAVDSRIHGIKNSDVIGCPTFAEMERGVRTILEGATVIGHNVSGDIKALMRKLPGWQPVRSMDTLRLTRRLRPGLQSYGLH